MTIAWLAIVNPKAGFSHSAKWQEEIAETLKKKLGAEVAFTQYPGHATLLAANTQAKGLAVFGGDGTIAEVVNGMNLDQQCLLLLPGGTGNGLARDLGIKSLDDSLNAVRTDRSRSLDLIRVTYQSEGQTASRLVISTASVGYAAEVVVLANHYFKSLGKFCYPLAATLQATRQVSFPITFQLDQNPAENRKLSNILVNNTHHAGNFRAFRTSDPGDGFFEVLLAQAGFINQFLHNLAVLSKTYFYATAAEHNAKSLILTLPTPQRLMIDGEILENVSWIKFEILPGKLDCYV